MMPSSLTLVFAAPGGGASVLGLADLLRRSDITQRSGHHKLVTSAAGYITTRRRRLQIPAESNESCLQLHLS